MSGTRFSIKDVWTSLPCGKMYAMRGVPSRALKSNVPLVLVHGLGMSHRYMRPAMEVFARDFVTYAVDLPGFGRSEKPACVFDVHELSESLRAWLDANDIERAVLLANSFGCQICAHLAANEASRVARLVLIAPTIDPDARTVRQQLFRLAMDAPHESPALMWLAFREYFFVTGFRRAYRTLRIALADHIEDRLPHITAQTLVIRGEHDPLVPQAWAQRVAATMPHARLVTIEDAAHAINYSAPEALARHVTPFIESAFVETSLSDEA
ncbi:MAG: alpha/beta hydrolase [Pyrinomonadaceae bacterium MAG19_C2-C3]|nr:alpha/beta hydrolase [Pyrinomonadaceae bacterium MAG19_C2-C3]